MQQLLLLGKGPLCKTQVVARVPWLKATGALARRTGASLEGRGWVKRTWHSQGARPPEGIFLGNLVFGFMVNPSLGPSLPSLHSLHGLPFLALLIIDTSESTCSLPEVSD